MKTLRILTLAAIAALSFSTAALAGGGHHGGGHGGGGGGSHDDYDDYDDDYSGHDAGYDDEERWIDVYNDAHDDVYYVYMRHRDAHRWGPDLLGNDVVVSGDTIRVEPVNDDGYCVFTMRVEFEDGDYLTSEPFNACTATDAVVTNRRIIVH